MTAVMGPREGVLGDSDMETQGGIHPSSGANTRLPLPPTAMHHSPVLGSAPCKRQGVQIE